MINSILANIQRLYNELYEFNIEAIKGKRGLLRSATIGKNADFSARAVIIGDPGIKPDHVGVPRNILARLFYPWIIHYIMKHPEEQKALKEFGGSPNIPYLHGLINNDLFEKRDIDPRIVGLINRITDIVIKDRVILAKRDPVLHKFSIRAFYIKPVEDTAMHISPLVCEQFNADFDGVTNSKHEYAVC
jgi:DNA-directed RNA polymerase subunit beta'